LVLAGLAACREQTAIIVFSIPFRLLVVAVVVNQVVWRRNLGVLVVAGRLTF
jgi:hypothetical protein